MATSEQLQELARDQLGRSASMLRFELKHLARALEPGEEPQQLAMGMVGRRGRLALLTDERLLLAKGWSPIPRATRVDAHRLSDLTRVERHAVSVALTFGPGTELVLMLAPEDAAVAMIDGLRAKLGLPDTAPALAELRALAKRKLGAKLAFAHDQVLPKLADGLRPDEDVQRLAPVTDAEGDLLIVQTTERVILVNAGLRSSKDRWRAWARDIPRAVARADAVTLDIDTGAERLRLRFWDKDRCDEFEAVLR